MSDFKVIPVDADFADQIRSTMKDNHGHTLEVTRSPEDNNNPCRLCLRDTHKGGEHILFSYSPFSENNNPYAEVGPVYIHRECVGPYKNIHTFPPDIKARPWLTVRGYDGENNLHTAELTRGADVEQAIQNVFEDSTVAYIHIRHGVVGCYLMRIERA